MTQLTPAGSTALMDLSAFVDNEDLQTGSQQKLGVLSIRASKFRIKYDGREQLISSGGQPVTKLEIVMLRAGKGRNKTYYATKYVEGANDTPDCYSMTGDKPDAQAPNPQAESCQGCPMNEFGSRMTDAGKKAKACSDNKRIAFVPKGDLANARFGGPMLLRLPTMSLASLDNLWLELRDQRGGVPYNSVVVALTFDADASFPLLRMNVVRELTGEEKAEIIQHYTSGAVDRVLQDGIDMQAESGLSVVRSTPAPEPISAPAEEDEPESEVVAETPVAAPKKRGRPPKRKTTVIRREEEAPASAPQVAEASSEINDVLDGIFFD